MFAIFCAHYTENKVINILIRKHYMNNNQKLLLHCDTEAGIILHIFRSEKTHGLLNNSQPKKTGF